MSKIWTIPHSNIWEERELRASMHHSSNRCFSYPGVLELFTETAMQLDVLSNTESFPAFMAQYRPTAWFVSHFVALFLSLVVSKCWTTFSHLSPFSKVKQYKRKMQYFLSYNPNTLICLLSTLSSYHNHQAKYIHFPTIQTPSSTQPAHPLSSHFLTYFLPTAALIPSSASSKQRP